MPVVAAASATAVRAFFGEAMRRAMRETDTENLFFGDGTVVVHPDHAVRGGGRTSAPRPRWAVGAERRAPEKQVGEVPANTPFASCGRTRGVAGLCDVALNAQVGAGNGRGMPGRFRYDPAS